MSCPEFIRLSRGDWRARREAYAGQVGDFVSRRRERRSRGEKHPIEDFIWEYYGLRSGRLLAWHPGTGVWLEGAEASEFSDREGYRAEGRGRILDAARVVRRRASGIRWIRNLLETIDSRSPVFACLGLHEWAMVYEAQDIRHRQLPLRLSHAATRRVVEQMPLRCTHFDAYRFFSKTAQPRNAQALSAENRIDHEQPGCLHANMDLFKWILKLQPLIPASRTADCFHLACRAREVDMRASPYEVETFGLASIRIETPAGRAEYVKEQRGVAERAQPLRRQLIACLADVELCLSPEQ